MKRQVPAASTVRPRPLPRALASFSAPGFLWLWCNSLFLASAFSLEILAQGWLILQEAPTGQGPLWIGIAAGLRGVGTLSFGLISGTLADRVDRRRLLGAVQGAGALVALAIGLLTLTGRLALPHLMAASFLNGSTIAFMWPSRNALLYDLVGRARLLNAIALAFAAANVMRVISPALGGWAVAHVHLSAPYFMVLASYSLAIFCLLGVPRTQRQAAASASPLQSLREGLSYLVRPGPVRSLMGLSVLMELFGFSYMYMLPVMARDVLGTGSTGLGMMMSAAGAGALLANLTVASLGDIRAKGALLVATAGGMGLSLVLFALSPWFLLSLFLLLFVGGCSVTYDTARSSLLQTLVPEHVRGRIVGLEVWTFGMQPVGGLQAGVVANFLGASVALAVGGGIIVLNALRLMPLARRLR